MADRFIHVGWPITRREARQLKRRWKRQDRQPWALFEAVVVAVVAGITFGALTYVLVGL
jgi:hypothetical protein